MFTKYQTLISTILDNMNVVGDVLMSGGKAEGNVLTDPDIKTAMSITGGTSPKKKKKKKKFPIIRRNLNRSL